MVSETVCSRMNYDGLKVYKKVDNILYCRGKSQTRKFAKELSFCLKLKSFNPYIFATQYRGPLIFQTMHFVRSNNLSLKSKDFLLLGCKDIGIRNFEFVAKTKLSDKIRI